MVAVDKHVLETMPICMHNPCLVFKRFMLLWVAGFVAPELYLRFELTVNGNPTGTDIAFDSSPNARSTTFANVAAATGYNSLSLGSADVSHLNSQILVDTPIAHADGIYTISVWSYFPLDPPTQRFRTLVRGQNADHQVLVDDNLELGVYCSGGCGGFVSSGYSVSGLAAGWYHLAAVADGTDTKFYISGSLVGTAAMVSTQDVYCIGNWQDGNQPWGKIDDFRFFSSEFAASEISLLAGVSHVCAPVCDMLSSVVLNCIVSRVSMIDCDRQMRHRRERCGLERQWNQVGNLKGHKHPVWPLKPKLPDPNHAQRQCLSCNQPTASSGRCHRLLR